jgi:hypothetical protein
LSAARTIHFGVVHDAVQDGVADRWDVFPVAPAARRMKGAAVRMDGGGPRSI